MFATRTPQASDVANGIPCNSTGTSAAVADDLHWRVLQRCKAVEDVVGHFRYREWPISPDPNLIFTDRYHFYGHVYDRINLETLQTLLIDGAVHN